MDKEKLTTATPSHRVGLQRDAESLPRVTPPHEANSSRSYRRELDVPQMLATRGDAYEEQPPFLIIEVDKEVLIKEEGANVMEEDNASSEDRKEKPLLSLLGHEGSPVQQSPGPDPLDLETVNIKEEHEELSISLVGEEVDVKEETDDCEAKPPFNQLHQHRPEDLDLPTSSQLKEEIDGEERGEAGADWSVALRSKVWALNPPKTEGSEDDEGDLRGAEITWNPDLNAYEGSSSCVESGAREDDVDQDCQLDMCSDESEDGENDWKEIRTDGSTVRKPFSCSQCGEHLNNRTCRHSASLIIKKCFRLKEAGKSHSKVQTGRKSFSCGDCDKVFKKKGDLDKHMRIHTGQKPFVCDICGRGFSQKPHLNRHTRIHTGQKPFECKTCGRSFNQKSHLTTHFRIHTEVKAFGCDICGQRFKHTATLNSHMKVHTGEKPFICENCGQRFSLLANLKRHTIIHTGEKPFACDFCDQKFNRKSLLKTHMKVHVETIVI